MIPLTETFTIQAPLADVWPLLADPARVAGCIPGATFSERSDDGLWRGTISISFGPTTAIFTGECDLQYDDEAHQCHIEGRGIDRRGASRATASFLLEARGTQTTEVSIDGNFNVSGPIETFASAGGVHVARALIAAFADNVSRLAAPAAAPQTGSAAAPPTPAPAPTPSLSAGWLLWQVIRGFFRKRKETET